MVLAIGIPLALAPAAFAQISAPPAQPAAPPVTVAPPTQPPPQQPTQADDRDSIEAGRKWLALLDAGKAGSAWDAASKQLKAKVTRDQFVADVRNARKPLGKLASRTPVKFARAHDLPDAPTGDYALVEYEAKYANGRKLSEQLIWVAEDDEVWRVAGYYYR